MRILFALFVALHGAVHLSGFSRAAGLGPWPAGAALEGSPWAWLAAAFLLIIAAGLRIASPAGWWIPALVGVAFSQGVLVAAWEEAGVWTVGNVVIAFPALLAALDQRPGSLRSRFIRETADALAMAPSPPEPQVLTEAELERLPPPVRRWLRRAGVVGRPRVHSFRARFRSWIRSGPDAGWMIGPTEQYEFFHPLRRHFWMRVSRWGVPAHVLHAYTGTGATMEARLAGLIPVVEESGPELTRSETVTVLDDIFLFAPGAVPWLPLEWSESPDGSVRVSFRGVLEEAVSGVLTFDEAGDLRDFVSEDRWRISGEERTRVTWSTPVTELAEYHGVRLPRRAEARWEGPEGSWCYARFTLVEVEYNVSRPPRR